MWAAAIACAASVAAPAGGAAPAAPTASSTGPAIVDREQNRNLTPVVVSPQYLVWESAGGEESSLIPSLRQLDLRTSRIRILVRGVVPHFGLASTTGWVVYAVGRGSTLVAVRHDGSRRTTLSRQLVAPIAARGEKVAWADQDATRQRVYVRDMSSGTRWLAADLPRCVGGRCYRIDAVGLADQGVVFVRGAIGPQPSFIVRRGFSDAKATRLAVPNDPQPDLAPSSVGALYYAFGRGWYRWDFGRPDTRLTRFLGARQTPVLVDQHPTEVWSRLVHAKLIRERASASESDERAPVSRTSVWSLSISAVFSGSALRWLTAKVWWRHSSSIRRASWLIMERSASIRFSADISSGTSRSARMRSWPERCSACSSRHQASCRRASMSLGLASTRSR